MNRQKIKNAYDPIRPDDEARERMLQNILLQSSEIPPAGKDDMMKHKKMRPMVLVALIALVAAMTVTVFAAEEISGWFKQYFIRKSENGLTPGQIEFLDKNEQIIDETQTNNGYDLHLKSVLSDGYTVYATIGLTAPEDVTFEELKKLWGSAIDFYDENKKPCMSWMMDICDDKDGLENTVDLVFEITPAEWSGSILTIRFNALERMFHDAEYEQYLLETKYAGQDNIMFTDEEAARVHQKILMAEGPWEFTIDLSTVETKVLELITNPVTVQTSYGFTEDGTDLYEEVRVTSLILSPLSATIQTDADYAPDFTTGDRKVYVVLTDGSSIELISNMAGGGRQYFNVASPIVLEEVDYVLLADGTKFMAP
ncbi:MAG: DUF4179 domain-containing protein [Oscillospiraceae bacterium]|nr:DUF4179 domain-containing protein [Oscillospiraceae bacterium]